MAAADLPFTQRKESVWVAGIIAIAAVLYMLHTRYTWVGFVNDDALNILLAKSILQGSYTALFMPGNPAVTTYPPIVPLILAPLVRLFEPHWALLKAVPMTLTLAAGLVFWQLVRRFLNAPYRLMAIGLFYFNPYIILQSSMVTSCAPFLFVMVCCFSYLHLMLSRKRRHDAWIFGILIVVAVLTRSIGMAMIPVFVAVLVPRTLSHGSIWRAYNASWAKRARRSMLFSRRNRLWRMPRNGATFRHR